MPDTVDSLEFLSLVVIVNRHAVAEDCAQSRPLLEDHSRKIGAASQTATTHPVALASGKNCQSGDLAAKQTHFGS